MKILDPEQIANILGPGWDAIASLPHLVTDLDSGTINSLEIVHDCCVGLWNYPLEILEGLESDAGRCSLRNWETEAARRALREIIKRANVSLYSRDVAIADTRSNIRSLERLYCFEMLYSEQHFIEDLWHTVAGVVDRIGWIAIPQLPNSNVIVYCSRPNLDQQTGALAEIQSKRGREVWRLPDV